MLACSPAAREMTKRGGVLTKREVVAKKCRCAEGRRWKAAGDVGKKRRWMSVVEGGLCWSSYRVGGLGERSRFLGTAVSITPAGRWTVSHSLEQSQRRLLTLTAEFL